MVRGWLSSGLITWIASNAEKGMFVLVVLDDPMLVLVDHVDREGEVVEQLAMNPAGNHVRVGHLEVSVDASWERAGRVEAQDAFLADLIKPVADCYPSSSIRGTRRSLGLRSRAPARSGP